MAHILEPMMGPGVEPVILDIALHLNPAKLRSRLLAEIAAIEQEGVDILLGYGLCGRALEGVVSQKSRLILPRVDDCVGALLGSRKRHQTFLVEQSGCYFLEPAWLGTELDIFNECTKGLERIPENRRSQIIHMTLRHYTKLAVLNHTGASLKAVSSCRRLARTHDLRCIELASDHSLLQRLAGGDWNGDEFVIAGPGEKIPFF
jgi:hypothetical protein